MLMILTDLNIIKKKIKETYFFFLTKFLKIYNQKNIKSYLKKHNIAKLHLGAGKYYLPEWLNTDILLKSPDFVYLDVSKKFPIDQNKFDYIYSEHMIEHLCYKDCLNMLMESYRILKPGGKIRITTPDLDVLIKIYYNKDCEFQDYIKWSSKKNDLLSDESINVFNNFFQSWGHKFIYNKNFLKKKLLDIGFIKINFFNLSISEDKNFENLENIKRLPKNFLQIESFTIEAKK